MRETMQERDALETRFLGAAMGRAVKTGKPIDVLPVVKAVGGKRNQGILWAMRKLCSAGEPPIPTLVHDTLVSHGHEDVALGVSEIALTTDDPEPLAKRITDAHHARLNRDSAKEIAEAVKEGDVKTASQQLKEVAARNLEAEHGLSVKLSDAIRLGLSKYAAEIGEKPIKTGIPAIDEACVLVPGQTLVIGAATNIGKSTLGTTIGMNVSEAGIGFGMVSVEDDVTDFGVRAACALTGISPDDIWKCRLSREQQEQIAKAFQKVEERNFQYSFVRDCDVAGVVAAIEHQASLGCRVVFVDYLQAITVAGATLTGRENVDAVLNELIVTARRCKVALILASQVVRPSERKTGQEPTLYWLKESGSIENRAQCVVMLWRDDHGQMFGRIAKAKRAKAGAKFSLTRHEKTGLLVQVDEAFSDADHVQAREAAGWGPKRKGGW